MEQPRIRKQTEKGVAYTQTTPKNKRQEKKQQQEATLKKRIIKAKVVIEKQAEKEADEEVEVVRDENDKIFKDLHYNNDKIAKDTQQVISQYPSNFLPNIFKGLIPLLVEKKVEPIKVKVMYNDLLDGKYHSKTSKSDKGIATGIKTLLKQQELQEYDKEDLTDLIKKSPKTILHNFKDRIRKETCNINNKR